MTSPMVGGHQVVVNPQATVGSNLNTQVMVAQRDSAVTAVSLTPTTTITGANTNSRTVSLVNLGQNGAGNVVIATLAFVSGVNAPAGVPKAVPVTPANANVLAGDVLQWQSTAVGTGIADPGGLVVISSGAKYA